MPGEADWLRERLEELERIERPSASDGERQAPLERAIEVSEQAVRRLSRRWL
jgi:hypothetical protein